MSATDLSFCTSKELIDELMRRTTFLGVVVHAEEELRGEWKGDRMFNVRFNANMDANQASRLLDVVAEHMDLHQP
jgi:hypothetical protein